MTTGLGPLLRNVFFWCGLATVNILLRDGQPVVLAVTAGCVVVLFALKVAVEAFPGDIGQATSRVAAHVIFWGTGYVILLLLYSIACARLLSGKQYHAWRESGMGVVGLVGPAVILAALRLLWWWWHRKPTPPADPPTRLKPVPKTEPDPEAERQRRSREAEQVAQQKRREDARAKVELFFNVHAPELAGRFTRGMLDEYVNLYMGDARAADVVEERGESLIAVIRQHLDRAVPKAAVQTLDDILAAFASRKRKIQESGLEDEDIEHLLIQLEDQREAAVTRAIQEGRV